MISTECIILIQYILANRIIKVFDKPTFFLLGLEIEILPIDD